MLKRSPMKRGTSQLKRSEFKKKPRKKHVNKLGGFPYVRSRELIDLFKSLPCQVTGAQGPSDPAHSNWPVHGKGGKIKASDIYIAAMSRDAHNELDQGRKMARAERQRMWWDAHVKSVLALLDAELWPADIPVPDICNYPF